MKTTYSATTKITLADIGKAHGLAIKDCTPDEIKAAESLMRLPQSSRIAAIKKRGITQAAIAHASRPLDFDRGCYELAKASGIAAAMGFDTRELTGARAYLGTQAGSRKQGETFTATIIG